MKMSKRVVSCCGLVVFGFAFVWACGFDDTLREYLDVRFWQPFSKQAKHFEKENVRRASAPYAGMIKGQSDTPLAKLRAAYQEISQPVSIAFDPQTQRLAVAAARADQSLTRREREEVDLIDAKIDMRAGQPHEPQLLLSAREKLQQVIRDSRTPELLSEARGWLAYVHFLLGEQTAAGKIYLDELNRDGSNLSRETLLNSLRRTYGYDGGPDLPAHLEEYFDTPEHAAFAIQLITNPRWNRYATPSGGSTERPDTAAQSYKRITGLIEKHRKLLDSETGSNALALLLMRTALRMGDPPTATRVAAMVPADSPVRADPDFNWMLASSHFLSRDYAVAEEPLRTLFRSPRSTDNQKAAAAYALCGVYQKTGNTIEQIRFALWLYSRPRNQNLYAGEPSSIEDQSVYWAASGWDLKMLLDAEATVDTLRSFLQKYPDVPDARLVRYSLAVRLSRENRYAEAAEIYQSINAIRRAPRLKRLAELYRETSRSDSSGSEMQEARYRLAEFLSSNSDRIYFNDALWFGLQRYALVGDRDSRLTGEERQNLMEAERALKDEQEERWRAYLILREIVRDAGKTDLGRKAARLAVRCLRGINLARFGRSDEIRHADIELSNWLQQ
jgi:tetratricopeptide (TPR) repeat protein